VAVTGDALADTALHRVSLVMKDGTVVR